MFQGKLLLLALSFFKISSFEPGEETIGLQQHQDVRWLKGIDIFKKIKHLFELKWLQLKIKM